MWAHALWRMHCDAITLIGGTAKNYKKNICFLNIAPHVESIWSVICARPGAYPSEQCP